MLCITSPDSQNTGKVLMLIWVQKRIKNRPHVLQKDSSMICKSFSGIVASISIAHLSIRKIMHTNHFFPKVQHILHVANYIKSFVKHERSACSRV
ncbi:unnamed protein product [Rhizophagus irregularis]|nr:unnamed protein product [Rhizophagus irregularis]